MVKISFLAWESISMALKQHTLAHNEKKIFAKVHVCLFCSLAKIGVYSIYSQVTATLTPTPSTNAPLHRIAQCTTLHHHTPPTL